LFEKYELLRRCTIIIYKDSVELITDKEKLQGLQSDLKGQLEDLYQDIKSRNVQKIKSKAGDVYQRALEKMQNLTERAENLTVEQTKKELLNEVQKESS